MVKYWVNLHGEWIDLSDKRTSVRRADAGEASEGELDFMNDGFVMVSFGDETHYVHESCIQAQRV